ncbi:MAG TPA: retropepsin-like aspartic protease [Candidatus Binatia bacterium]|nr:retropepsin-like aspartic protease [Candidatus Binatia bacterium]
MTGSDPTLTGSARPPTVYGVMPRPGQPGALHFDGRNVTEFLENWDLECNVFGYSADDKCTHLPSYCDKTLRKVVKDLPGYANKNWDTLQLDLKGLFWQHDSPENTPAALHEVVNEARTGKIDLNVYILRYSSISEVLFNQGALSTLERISRLLDGLSDEHRRKALGFCVKQKWKLSALDVGKTVPDYNKLKEYILEAAETNQALLAYSNERALRESNPVSEVPTASPSILGTSSVPVGTGIPAISSATPVTSTPTRTRSDSVAELTEKLSQLTLLLQAHMKPQSSTTSSSASTQSSATRPLRCLWCDSPDHVRRNCSEFTAALQSGITRFNENRRLINCATGEELAVMYGRGGMKALISNSPPASAVNVSTRNILLDDPYAHVGHGAILRTTLDFEKGTRVDEIVDVNVDEKRKRDSEPRFRNVRPRTETNSAPAPAAATPPERRMPRDEAVDTEMSDVPPLQPLQPLQRSQPVVNGPPPAEPGKKFKLASDLSQTVSTSQIGEKIMDTPVQLSIREILAVSGDVTGYLHDQTRKRRIPIEPVAASTPVVAGTSATSADVNSTALKSYYALPSGHAKVILDDRVAINATLDNGSEVNLMPKRTFDQLELPIDTDIHWRINAYDTDAELESSGPIGVCHDVPVSIGGVEVKQHFFVVKHSNADLILGRPWERAVRASYINEDDGSYTVLIKSPDGLREVTFCAAKAEHERNREAARPLTHSSSNTGHLKV